MRAAWSVGGERSAVARDQCQRRENSLADNAAHRYQQIAEMPEKHFETAVATAKDTAGQVTTAFSLRGVSST